MIRAKRKIVVLLGPGHGAYRLKQDNMGNYNGMFWREADGQPRTFFLRGVDQPEFVEGLIRNGYRIPPAG
jgi:hypothetical protein